jgi:flagellin
MALRIQTNTAAINAHRQLEISDANMAKSLERLSSGFRINRAADDAAGLSMSNKFVAQVRSMGVASRNASQANSLLQIAEGGMDQIGNILSRLKELATQAASANSSSNLTDINAEASKLTAEIDRIANSTTFQGTALLTGFGGDNTTGGEWDAVDNIYGVNVANAAVDDYTVAYDADTDELTITRDSDSVSQTVAIADGAQTVNFASLGISFKTTAAFDADTAGTALAAANLSVADGGEASFQIGETNHANYRISFQISDVRTAALGVNGIDLATAAQGAMDDIDAAIATLSSARASIGAVQNRLGYTAANLATAIENANAANSIIKDVDMAAEMTSFTKNQILVQAGTSMLAQANSSPQLVLSLFGGR